MALPSSGPLSIAQIAAEFGTATNLGAQYGVAGGIPTSGAISIGHFYGKTDLIVLNISNTVKPNIQAMLNSAGWDGKAKVQLEVNAGALVNTLIIPQLSYPRGLRLVIGSGARIGGVGGGRGVEYGNKGSDQSGGGTGLYTRSSMSIYNAGFVSGGGQHGSPGNAYWVKYSATSASVSSSWASGGAGEGFAGPNTLTIAARSVGEAGNTVTYSGAVLGGQTQPWARGDNGGSGGTWGNAGSSSGGGGGVGGTYVDSGYERAYTYEYITPAAVDGNAYITWEALGTIQGSRV